MIFIVVSILLAAFTASTLPDKPQLWTLIMMLVLCFWVLWLIDNKSTPKATILKHMQIIGAFGGVSLALIEQFY